MGSTSTKVMAGLPPPTSALPCRLRPFHNSNLVRPINRHRGYGVVEMVAKWKNSLASGRRVSGKRVFGVDVRELADNLPLIVVALPTGGNDGGVDEHR